MSSEPGVLAVEVTHEPHAGQDAGEAGIEQDDKDGGHVNAEGMHRQGFDDLRNALIKDQGGDNKAEGPRDGGIEERNGVESVHQNNGTAPVVHQGERLQKGAAAVKILGGQIEKEGADENDEQKEGGLKDAEVDGAGFGEDARIAKTRLHFSPMKQAPSLDAGAKDDHRQKAEKEDKDITIPRLGNAFPSIGRSEQ